MCSHHLSAGDASEPGARAVQPPRSLRLDSPAKVNLHLRVGQLSADGFHPVQTWMATVGLFDTLEFEADPREVEISRGADAVRLTCDDPTLACDQSNLVIRAAAALYREAFESDTGGVGATRQHAPARPGYATLIRLTKRIPTRGGLGGGSSNAATALIGLNALWGLGYPTDRLAEIAGQLGSDVPFFLRGPSSVCTGRGEIVRPIARPKPKWCVLLLPRGMRLPTPAVYRRFDELRLGSERVVGSRPAWDSQHVAMVAGATSGSIESHGWPQLSADQLLPLLVNDLEPAAFSLEPALGRTRSECEGLLQRPVRMSGSGSSLFTLYDTKPEARAAVEIHERVFGQVGALGVPLAV